MTEHTAEHLHDDRCVNCGLDFDFDLPPVLVDTAHQGDLVVFAGAGVSTEVASVFPSTFYDQVKARVSAVGEPPFPELMEAFEREHGRQELLRALKRRFNYVDSFPSPRGRARQFHRELATMPYLRDVITTNWDTYFEEECLATPIVTGSDYAFHDMPGRRVYKIHGSISALSTIVLTEGDYDRRLEELRDNPLGGTLRHLLATKTVVFVGYSLRDWNFRRLYNAVRADMGALAPRAYWVSPFPGPEAEELGLISLRTSGVRFLQELKACLTESHFLPDAVYEAMAQLENMVLEAKATVARYSHKKFPAVAHCWAYHEGLLDACGRIRLRRGSGEYSDAQHVVRLARWYEEKCDRALERDRYFDGAYLDGYANGLTILLGNEEDDLLGSVPLFCVYGSGSAMRTPEDLEDALEHSRRRAPKARREAKEITAGLPEDMVMTHGPFLHDVPSDEW